MAQMYVDSASLRAKAAELEELNNQFKSEIGGLQDNEQALAGMWEGTAKENFRTAFNNDVVQMNNFYNAIGMYISKLEEIAAKYEQAEQQNAELASTRTYNG